MITPLFTPYEVYANDQARLEQDPIVDYLIDHERLKRAHAILTEWAQFSAVDNSIDMPIAAGVLSGDCLITRESASDRKNGNPDHHAEFLALRNPLSSLILSTFSPDAIVSTMEPCTRCQDTVFDAGIGTIAYSLSRTHLEVRGLVNDRDETIEQRIARLGLSVTVERIYSEEDDAKNLLLFDHVQRDKITGEVQIDTERLQLARSQI